MYSANFSTQWKPAPMKLLNAEYRYLRDSVDFYGNKLDQVNVSGQWPVAQRWYAIGQVSYSLADNKTIENIFGFQYNADCWIFRLMAQRYATSSVETNTAFYFQLELNGLSSIGSNPLNALRRSIPGYEPLSP